MIPSRSNPYRTLYKQQLKNLQSHGWHHTGKKFVVWFFDNGKLDDFAWDWDEEVLDEYLSRENKKAMDSVY